MAPTLHLPVTNATDCLNFIYAVTPIQQTVLILHVTVTTTHRLYLNFTLYCDSNTTDFMYTTVYRNYGRKKKKKNQFLMK